MSSLGVLDAIVLVPTAILAIAAIALPRKRALHMVSVIALGLVVTGYTVFRPNGRAALAYYESMGGSWSQEWLAGVQSLLAVTRYFPWIVAGAALLLAVIAWRSR